MTPSKLTLVCQEIIAVKNDAGETYYRSYNPEIVYQVLANDNAERLAKACLIMQEALEKVGTMDGWTSNQGDPEIALFARDALKKVEEIFK